MPNCEICGRYIEKAKRAKIEGTIMEVCPSCASFGEGLPDLKGPREKSLARQQRRSEREKLPEDAVISSYSSKIKSAREKKGMTMKELADALNIKESMLHQMERSKLTPDLNLAKRLEKSLKITLIEKLEPEEVELGEAGASGMTLGDFIKVKKKKK